LFETVEVTTHLLYAAAGGSNDVIKIFKVIDEQVFRGLGILFIAAVGHGLPATGLVKRVTDIKAESLHAAADSVVVTEFG
jgi:hypothetical protein